METTQQPGVTREWLSYADISEYANISRWTVLRAIQSGELAASKVGSRTLVRRRDLDSFLERRAVGEN